MVTLNPITSAAAPYQLNLLTAQQMFYTASSSAGTPSFSAYIAAYEF